MKITIIKKRWYMAHGRMITSHRWATTLFVIACKIGLVEQDELKTIRAGMSVDSSKGKQQPLFIAVFASEGLITSVKTGSDLKALILYMQQECGDERFDPETDDARIFDADGDEVYVFPSPGELAKEGMGVYYCSHCQFSQRVHVDDPVRCETCEDDMERLDTLGVNV